jgi:hypothetical protein
LRHVRVTLAVLALLAVGGSGLICAQDRPLQSIDIPFIDFEPQLDDFAGMEPAAHVRGKLAKVSGFIQRTPHDGEPSTFHTEVYVGYDRKKLYAVFVAFDDEPDKIRAHMAPRGEVFNDDSVNIMIDTFNDQRRAYFFLSTPLGIQAEGQFIEGEGFDGSFNAVWDSEGRLTDRGFLVKISVPFLSIRFPQTEQQTWRVIFNRTIPRLSEDTFWPHYSLAIEGRLNQTAMMTGVRDISPSRNIQLVPFTFFRDFKLEQDRASGSQTVQDGNEESIGLDAKFVLKDALVLDVTANPDFSQIESDEPQVTVNQRFEVFFPERRPFFLENSNIFQTTTNLLNTRRIVDPSGGVKLTGKQGPYSVGVLFADDRAPGKNLDPGDPLEGERALVGVVRISRDISRQSTLGIMLTDRELADGHNRVAAVDGRIKLNDNWVGQFQLAGSKTRPANGKGIEDDVSLNVHVNRDGLHFSNHTHFLYTGPEFRTDLGFLGGMQRPDSQNFHNRVAYRFRPVSSRLTDWGPSLFVGRILNTDGLRLDWSVSPEIEWNWAGGMGVEIGYDHTQARLLAGEFGLTESKDFPQNRWSFDFETRDYATVSFGLELDVGTSINFVPADAAELEDLFSTELGVLWRPISPLQFNFTVLRTELTNRDGSGRIFTNTIGRVRANWQFTRELSVRVIGELEKTDAVPGETSLTDDERFTADLLVRYLWNPWWALYVGYNTNGRDFQAIDDMTGLPGNVSENGQQLFFKFSYLFQL